MSVLGSNAASYLEPYFNGNSMGSKGTMAPPAVNDKARLDVCKKKVGDEKIPAETIRKCSNKSGKGRQCPRPAFKHFRRCEQCHMSNRRSIRRNYVSRMVIWSRDRDRAKFKWSPGEYVTRDWLAHRLETKGPNCYWCGKTDLNTRKRLNDDGLQLERLSNDLPHLKRNCVFACGYCNRRSWSKKWKEVPFHLRKPLSGVELRLTHKARITQERVCLEIHSTRFGSRPSGT